jgi:hypothetical protein
VTPYFALYGPEGLSLAMTLIVALLFLGIGQLVAVLHRQSTVGIEDVAFDLAAGWGVVTTLMIVAALLHVPMTVAAFVLTGLGLVGLCKMQRRGKSGAREWGLIILMVVLCFPLMIIAVVTPPVMYDEFGHWLPNARFVFEHGILPSAANPNTGSDIPAYPYGGPFINALASVLAGRWLEAPSKLFTILLFGAVALAWAQTLAQSRSRHVGFGGLAIALILLTIFNPTFDPRIALTAYTDSPSAALLALFGLSCWCAVSAVGDDRTEDGKRWFRRAGYVALAMIAARDTNLVLVAAGGLGVLAAGAPLLRRRWRLMWLADFLIVPPLAGFLIWRLYRAVSGLPQPLGILPWNQWQWDAVPIVLISAFKDRLPAHPILGVAALIAAVSLVVIGLWTLQRSAPNERRVVVIVGVTTTIWLIFLAWAYIGTMTPRDVGIAMSFWRYTGQLAPLFLVAAIPFLRQVLDNRMVHTFVTGLGGKLAGLAAAGLMIVVPVLSAPHWRNDCNVGDSVATRDIARALAPELEKADHILVVHTEYAQWMATDIAYSLGLSLDRVRWLDAPVDASLTGIAVAADDRTSALLDLRPMNRGAIHMTGDVPAVMLYHATSLDPQHRNFVWTMTTAPMSLGHVCEFPDIRWR